ncbi:MAG: O-antigen ligase family protein [Thermodesulfovibrionales bacterium]|nr:O-antigen ligase family protein [Thermodesulfovibrionales bacterium]
MKIFKDKAIRIDFRDKTIVALSLLAGWSILVSILGPYPLDSLNALRKNLLVQSLIFLVIIAEFKSCKELRTLFRIVAVSFAIVTLASIAENFLDLINLNINFNELQSKRTHRMFIAGYASNATFYLPFTAAWLTSLKKTPWEKWLGLITILLGFLTVFLYNSRAAIFIVPLAILIILFLSKKYRLLVTAVIIILTFCASTFFLSKSDTLSKYKSLSDLETFSKNERWLLWEGTLHIIKERPITGYGYGWKKIALIAKDSKFQEYWKQHHPYIYSYYAKDASSSYGRVNPHNLILQIVFEIGLIGLILFLWLWTTIILKILKTASVKGQSDGKTFALCSLGVLVSYALINIPNGYWQEAYGNMIFLFIASISVIHRQHAQRIED